MQVRWRHGEVARRPRHVAACSPSLRPGACGEAGRRHGAGRDGHAGRAVGAGTLVERRCWPWRRGRWSSSDLELGVQARRRQWSRNSARAVRVVVCLRRPPESTSSSGGGELRLNRSSATVVVECWVAAQPKASTASGGGVGVAKVGALGCEPHVLRRWRLGRRNSRGTNTRSVVAWAPSSPVRRRFRHGAVGVTAEAVIRLLRVAALPSHAAATAALTSASAKVSAATGKCARGGRC